MTAACPRCGSPRILTLPQRAPDLTPKPNICECSTCGWRGAPGELAPPASKDAQHRGATVKERVR